MGAALSVFVIISISVFFVRLAAVALRHTGLDEPIARFQALSAFTGTGFTTSEAESIVADPLRRRIISILMMIGNVGLVGVVATLVVSFVQTAGEPGAVAEQMGWLALGLFLLWFLILNPVADRLMCTAIGRMLGGNKAQRSGLHCLAVIGEGSSLYAHEMGARWHGVRREDIASELERFGQRLVAVIDGAGRPKDPSDPIAAGDRVLSAGSDKKGIPVFANPTEPV